MPAADPEAKNIFLAALDIESGDKRLAFLSQTCGQDAALRRRVDALLAAHEEPDSRLDKPALAQSTEFFKPSKEMPGSLVGPYKLLQQIGEGGFGVVYMAEQQEPVRRMVALKIIKPGMDSKEVIARFEAERQALALMEHPNIARVLDAGTTDSGRPYFVMELVKGVPLTEYCDKNHLSTEQRLTLFVTVCHAVQHAHQKGVIHRDIKPSNVMVTLHDGHPVPKVIDFGVAKATNQRLTERTLFTSYGQMIGTPAYMSPEQAEMSGLDIDTRSDIYSLGVLLYELLTGSTPFDSRRLRDAGYMEMQRIIREEEPPRPSTRVSTLGESLTVLSNQRSIDPKRFSELLRGDIDLIVMKALEKERNRRYDTPNSFAADVERYLHHEPVEARAPSTYYRMRKFAERNKTAVITGGLVASALVLATIVSSSMAVVASRERERAVELQKEADANSQQAIDHSQRAQESEAKAIDAAMAERLATQRAEAAVVAEREAKEAESRLRISAEQRRLDIERQNVEIEALNVSLRKQKEDQRRIAYVGQMNLIQKAWDSSNVDRIGELLNATLPMPGEEDLRGFEWHFWHRKIHPEEDSVRLKLLSPASFSSSLMSSDGVLATIVSGPREYVLQVCRTNSGAILFEKVLGPAPTARRDAEGAFVRPENITAWDVLFVDSERVAVVKRTNSRRSLENGSWQIQLNLQLIDLRSGEIVLSKDANHNMYMSKESMAFSRDGSRVAIVDSENAIQILDCRTGDKVATVPVLPEDGFNMRMFLALNADGSRVAYTKLLPNFTVKDEHGITIADVGGDRSIVTAPISMDHMEFSPDGTKLAVIHAREDRATVFDAETGMQSCELANPQTRLNVSSLRAQPKPTSSIQFSPNSKWISYQKVSFGGDRRGYASIQFWELSTGKPGPQLNGYSNNVVQVGFSSDSEKALTLHGTGNLVTWALPKSPENIAASDLQVVASSMDGRWVVHGYVPPETKPNEELASRSQDLTSTSLQLVDTTGQVPPKSLALDRMRWAMRFSASGAFLVGTGIDDNVDEAVAGQVRVWETATFKQLVSIPTSVLSRSDYGREGAFMMLMGMGMEKGRVSLGSVTQFAFNQGQSRIAIAFRTAADNPSEKKCSIKVFELPSGRELHSIEPTELNAANSFLQFSENGNQLICGQINLPNAIGFTPTSTPQARNQLAIWDLASGKRILDVPESSHVIVDSGSATIAAKTKNQTAGNASPLRITVWNQATGEEICQLPSSEAQFLTGLTYHRDSNRIALASGREVSVYDARTHKELAVLRGHTDEVWTVAFSPDGKRIATSTGRDLCPAIRSQNYRLEKDRGTKVWDVATGQELLSFDDSMREPISKQVHEDRPIQFTADGLSLLTGERWSAVPISSKTWSEELLSASRTILQQPNLVEGDYESTLSRLYEVSVLDPTNPETRLLQAMANYRLRRWTMAMSMLQEIREAHAQRKTSMLAEEWTLLAMTQYSQGKKEEAMQSLDQARLSDSLDEAGWQSLMMEAETIASVPKAEDNPNQWIGGEFMPRRSARWRSSPGLPSTKRNLPYSFDRVVGDRLAIGTSTIGLNEVVPLKLAAEYYTRVLERHPDDPETLVRRGIAWRIIGEYDRAIEDYSSSIRIKPTASTFANRGRVYLYDKEDLEKALPDFDESLRLDPANASTHASRALLRRRQGELDDALKSFEEAIRLAPSTGAYLTSRAYVWAARGDRERMMQDLDEGARISPDDAIVWADRAWMLATSPNDTLRDGKQALEAAMKACELSKWKRGDFLNVLAAAHAELGDFAKAIEWETKAIELTPLAKRPKLELRLELFREGKPYRGSHTAN